MTRKENMHEQKQRETARHWIICLCGRRTYSKDGQCAVCKVDDRRMILEAGIQ